MDDRIALLVARGPHSGVRVGPYRVLSAFEAAPPHQAIVDGSSDEVRESKKTIIPLQKNKKKTPNPES